MSENIQIYDVKWEIGAHISFSGSITNSLQKAIGYGMYAVQIFLGNPKSFNRHKVSNEDIISSKQIIKRFPMHIISHFPYVANLAGSKDILAWNGDDIQDKKTMNIITNLQYELNMLSNFTEKTGGVVVHPGNHKDKNKGLKAISKSINKIDFVKHSKLILENSAGGGTSLATTFEEIKIIIDNVEQNKQKHIGVCIDTCHLHSFGSYDLRKCDEIERMFVDFDKIVGLDKLALIHLNDSKTPFASKKDRHELIMHGVIWKDDNSSLILLLNKCKKLNIPVILETDISDMLTISKLSNF